MFHILLVYVHSCFAIILKGKRENWLLCLVCLPGVCDCRVAIPLSAMGLSAVCDCDTHLLVLVDIHAKTDGFGESAHLLGLV